MKRRTLALILTLVLTLGLTGPACAAGAPAPKTASSSFSDVTDKNAYYYDAVLWAVENGLTQGVGGGRFNLTGTLAYDQIFTLLCRFAGEEASGSNWSDTAVSWAKTSGLTCV